MSGDAGGGLLPLVAEGGDALASECHAGDGLDDDGGADAVSVLCGEDAGREGLEVSDGRGDEVGAGLLEVVEDAGGLDVDLGFPRGDVVALCLEPLGEGASVTGAGGGGEFRGDEAGVACVKRGVGEAVDKSGSPDAAGFGEVEVLEL